MITSTNPSSEKSKVWEAFQSFSLGSNLKERFARVPCQRKALLFGVAGGSCISVLRFIALRRLRPSLNWGVYSFIFLSSISYYDCSKKRVTEVENIQQVVNKMNKLKPSNNLISSLKSNSQDTEKG